MFPFTLLSATPVNLSKDSTPTTTPTPTPRGAKSVLLTLCHQLKEQRNHSSVLISRNWAMTPPHHHHLNTSSQASQGTPTCPLGLPPALDLAMSLRIRKFWKNAAHLMVSL